MPGQLYYKSAGRNYDGDFFSDKTCLTCTYYWAQECAKLNDGDEMDPTYYTFGSKNPDWLVFQHMTLEEKLTHGSNAVREIVQEELAKIQKEEARLLRHSIHRVRNRATEKIESVLGI